MITKDMTKGEPWKLIVGFSLPLMLGNIFQQFYTVVDTVVVGKALGVNGLAALGAASATVLAQLFAAGYCFYSLHKIEIIKSSRKEKGRLCRTVCLEQIKIALPMGLQNMITAVGGLAVQAVLLEALQQ